jgi:hypothetical protein
MMMIDDKSGTRQTMANGKRQKTTKTGLFKLNQARITDLLSPSRASSTGENVGAVVNRKLEMKMNLEFWVRNA